MFTADEITIIKRVLLTDQLQQQIGAENWDLTEAEEEALWALIRKLEAQP